MIWIWSTFILFNSNEGHSLKAVFSCGTHLPLPPFSLFPLPPIIIVVVGHIVGLPNTKFQHIQRCMWGEGWFSYQDQHHEGLTILLILLRSFCIRRPSIDICRLSWLTSSRIPVRMMKRIICSYLFSSYSGSSGTSPVPHHSRCTTPPSWLHTAAALITYGRRFLWFQDRSSFPLWFPTLHILYARTCNRFIE